jgi:hypothetical protein
MKVHLCRTDNFPAALAEKVSSILNGVDNRGARGNWHFTFTSDPVDDVNENSSHQEFFNRAIGFRRARNIPADQFVVLLTGTRNQFNWFSAFDGVRNAYVFNDDWNELIGKTAKWPVAYSVVENVLQTLMGLNINDLDSPYIHIESASCMNDFCQRKKQIIHKILSGNICNTCRGRLAEQGVEPGTIRQALGIFDTIRQGCMEDDGEEELERPHNLNINNDGLSIPGYHINEVLMGAAQETLYIFLLEFKRIRYQDMLTPLNLAFMRDLYQILSARPNNPIDNMLRDSNSFAIYRANMNRVLERRLPADILPFFTIASNANYNTIQLDRSLVGYESWEIRVLINQFRQARGDNDPRHML